jgi:hypothetical protein
MIAPARSLHLAAAAVAALTALGAGNLLNAWRHSPYDAWGWVALLVWLAPLGRRRGAGEPALLPWSYAGLALALLGQLVEMNTFKYAGFATACAAFAPMRSWRGWIWWIVAAAWLPAFGWALAPYLSAGIVPWLRAALAGLGAAAAFTGTPPVSAKGVTS